MKIETLFPELANLYGDSANIRYLSACAPDAEILYTSNQDTPRFIDEPVNMLYLGSMSESKQELAIARLQPHTERLRALIESGTVVLATGNALELFGMSIREGSRKIPALGLFPFHAERDLENRHNSMFLGQFEDMKIVGAKSQFSFSYGAFHHPFIQVAGGFGLNPDLAVEGIHYRNLFATYLLGPFLVLNPLFTKYLLRLLNHDDTLAFEQEAMDAYRYRLEGLEAPGVRFLMGEHG